MGLEAAEPPAVCRWASDCTSLSLSKMEITLEPASQKCSEGTEDRMRKDKRKHPALWYTASAGCL